MPDAAILVLAKLTAEADTMQQATKPKILQRCLPVSRARCYAHSQVRQITGSPRP